MSIEDECLTTHSSLYFGLPVPLLGVLWLGSLMLYTMLSARRVVGKRSLRSSPPNRGSVASARSNQSIIELYSEYETIPEEYLEQKKSSHQKKQMKYKNSFANTDDPISDNHTLKKEADQLLRILTNPEMFIGSKSEKTTNKKQGVQGVHSLMAGIFQITGSVAASTQEVEATAQRSKVKDNIVNL